MRPEYWIGIMAIVGSVLGTILSFAFPILGGASAAITGTIVGITIGTAIYAIQKKNNTSDK